MAFISGGLFAGTVGFAIGEISNATLHLRKGLPITLSTGTSTFVLYVTLLAANVTNLVVIFASPIDLSGGVTIPWSVAVIVAPVVIVGGQVGAFLNNRLPHGIVIRLLVVSYLLVGVITLARLVI